MLNAFRKNFGWDTHLDSSLRLTKIYAITSAEKYSDFSLGAKSMDIESFEIVCKNSFKKGLSSWSIIADQKVIWPKEKDLQQAFKVFSLKLGLEKRIRVRDEGTCEIRLDFPSEISKKIRDAFWVILACKTNPIS